MNGKRVVGEPLSLLNRNAKTIPASPPPRRSTQYSAEGEIMTLVGVNEWQLWRARVGGARSL